MTRVVREFGMSMESKAKARMASAPMVDSKGHLLAWLAMAMEATYLPRWPGSGFDLFPVLPIAG